MRRRYVAAVLTAVAVLLPATAQSQTTTTSSVTSTSSTTTTTTVVVDPLCDPTPCSAQPPSAFLATSGAEVLGDPGSSTWTRPLPDGTHEITHADAFFPIEPTHTLAVVRGDALTLRFDPQLPPSSLDIGRGAAKDTPSADRQVLSVPVDDPSRFTADLPDGLSYLAVSAGFAQGNSSYFFKLDVRPPPAVPGPRVVRQPNFTG